MYAVLQRRTWVRVKSISTAMCFARLSGSVLPGQSSTVGCVNYGVGTFFCQPLLPVDQWTWLSTTVSLSGTKCSAMQPIDYDLLQKWAGNRTAGRVLIFSSVPNTLGLVWAALKYPLNVTNAGPWLVCTDKIYASLLLFIIIINVLFISDTKAVVILISYCILTHGNCDTCSYTSVKFF